MDFMVYGQRMDALQVAGVALIFLAAAAVSLNWNWRLPRSPRPGAV